MSQPVEEYPSTVMTRQPDSSHTNGSFGPVFAVLAVIVVISAVACVVGRVCSKRGHRKKEAAHHPTKPGKQSQGQVLPKEWEPRSKPKLNMRDGDIEFGFDKKMSSSKGKTNPTHHKPEVRFSDNV